jgi:hypothetical protein
MNCGRQLLLPAERFWPSSVSLFLFSPFAATNSATGASEQEDVRIGHVTLWANRHQCKKLKFDNDTSRF